MGPPCSMHDARRNTSNARFDNLHWPSCFLLLFLTRTMHQHENIAHGRAACLGPVRPRQRRCGCPATGGCMNPAPASPSLYPFLAVLPPPPPNVNSLQAPCSPLTSPHQLTPHLSPLHTHPHTYTHPAAGPRGVRAAGGARDTGVRTDLLGQVVLR